MTTLYRFTDGESVPPLPNEPSRVLLVANVPASGEFTQRLARAIEASGCRFLLAWGIDCEAWHDAVDEASLERHDFRDVPPSSFLMTTWHDDEPVEETMWFAEHGHIMSYDDHPLPTLVLLHLAAEPDEVGMLARFYGAIAAD